MRTKRGPLPLNSGIPPLAKRAEIGREKHGGSNANRISVVEEWYDQMKTNVNPEEKEKTKSTRRRSRRSVEITNQVIPEGLPQRPVRRRNSLSNFLDVRKNFPDLKKWAQKWEEGKEISQKLEESSKGGTKQQEMNVPNMTGKDWKLRREEKAKEFKTLLRVNSDSTEMRGGGTRPLTVKHDDGTEWFVRGPMNNQELMVFEPETDVEAQLVDQYGFVLEEKRGEAPLDLNLSREERYVRKWRAMIGSGGEDWKAYRRKKPQELRRRIRKGIPDCMRGLVWQLLSGSRDLLLRNQGVYEHFLFYESSSCELDIIRDISRTFPSHVYFQQRHGPGQRSLYNVLKAYSVYDKDVGYVQGMGFLAGLLLLYMGEEDAFWLLVALMKGAVHEPMQHGLPLVQLYLWQFQRLVQSEMPDLGCHLESECVTPSMYASQWFITVFCYSFPFPLTLRVWDVFLSEGMSTVFQIGLALLKTQEQDLVHQPFETVVQNLRSFPESVLDASILFPIAFSTKVEKKLRELRSEYDNIHNEAVTAPLSRKVSSDEEEIEQSALQRSLSGRGIGGLRAAMRSVATKSLSRRASKEKEAK